MESSEEDVTYSQRKDLYFLEILDQSEIILMWWKHFQGDIGFLSHGHLTLIYTLMLFNENILFISFLTLVWEILDVGIIANAKF